MNFLCISKMIITGRSSDKEMNNKWQFKCESWKVKDYFAEKSIKLIISTNNSCKFVRKYQKSIIQS